MKKLFAIILVFIFLCVATVFLAWNFKTSIASYILSKQLHSVPVSIEVLKLSKTNAMIQNLFIGNPKRSKTDTALETQEINIEGTLKELRADPLTIDGITVNDTLLAIEYYNESGSENNWSVMLNDEEKKEKVDKNGRGYLIRRLTFNNLTVQVTKANGETTRYPTLEKLEFYNISDETGFPIKDIEKAIFNVVLKSIFQRFGLDNLLKSLDPTQWVPGIIPFFGKKAPSQQLMP